MITQLIFTLSIFLVVFAFKSIALSLLNIFSIENYKVMLEESQSPTQLKNLYEEVLLYYQEQKRTEVWVLLNDIEKRIEDLN